ncbi:MAG: cytochrome c peroxidase [Burkholderiales bacterium]
MRSLINNNLFKVAGRTRGLGVVLASAIAGVALAFFIDQPQAQLAVGLDLAPVVRPLSQVTVLDVNVLGILDKSGPNTGAWPKITEQGKKTDLQRLGKALFYDMQVGGDGIQACASCHFHAGADNRKANQMSSGLKAGDFVQDLIDGGANAALTSAQFGPAGLLNRGLPANEAALIAAGGWTPDLANGTPFSIGNKAPPVLDVNDIVSSQGPRSGQYLGLDPGAAAGTYTAIDRALLDTTDSVAEGFDFAFNSPQSPTRCAMSSRAIRRPRSTPSTTSVISGMGVPTRFLTA